MTREIKFRAKRIDNNDWVYGHYFISPLTDENSGTKPFFLSGEKRHCICDPFDGVAYVVDPKTLGQFTGLKDMDGNEIYEGDVRNFNNQTTGKTHRYIIEFSNGGFIGGSIDDNTTSLWLAELTRTTIIGNIHDNPEILSKEV